MPKAANPETRERLLQVALQTFGNRDFDSVSIREIVSAAGANIAAVSYHFGGKQGLYLATADYLVSRMQTGLAPAVASIRARANNCGHDDCRALLAELVQILVHTLMQGEFADHAAGFIFREQNHPTAAFDILFDGLMLPLQQTYAVLISRILGQAEDEREMKLTVHALMGQIIAFRAARTTILRRLGQDRFDTGDVAEIAQLISQLTLNALAGGTTGETS